MKDQKTTEKSVESPFRNMGIGDLIKPSVTFARKFRWTLESEGLPEYYVKKLNIDYFNKTLKFEYYDVCDSEGGGFHIFNWLENMKNYASDRMMFRLYDGCGYEMFKVDFSSLTLLEHHADYDYELSEISTQVVALKYGHHQFECSYGNLRKTRWGASFEGCPDEIHVVLDKRPNVRIKEQELPFLNTKTWIPGTAQWENVIFTLADPRKADKRIYAKLLSFGKPMNVTLTYYENNIMLESWNLKDAWVRNMDSGKYRFDLQYSTVEYKSYVMPKIKGDNHEIPPAASPRKSKKR